MGSLHSLCNNEEGTFYPSGTSLLCQYPPKVAIKRLPEVSAVYSTAKSVCTCVCVPRVKLQGLQIQWVPISLPIPPQ